MKNLNHLSTKQDLNNYIYNLWSTEEFKKSHKDPNGYIHKIVEKFCEHPRFFAEMTDPSIEWAQFYSYFNVLILRTYHNKTIQDLYYLHELVHMATMEYYPNYSFDKWLEKMIDNEMEASLESEILVYENLNVRGSSFNFEIWYDSLPKDILKNRDALKSHRRGRMKNPQTDVEIVLNKYNNNNQIWGEIWRDNFQKVEQAMDLFKKESLMSHDEAISNYLTFIDKNTTDGILFKTEAEKFSKIYLNKKDV